MMVDGQSKLCLIKRKFWIIVHGRKRYQRFSSFGVKCLFLPWGWEIKLLWLYSHVVHTLFSGLLISSQILPFNCNFNERSGYVTRSLRRWHEPRFLPIGVLFVLRFCFVFCFFLSFLNCESVSLWSIMQTPCPLPINVTQRMLGD